MHVCWYSHEYRCWAELQFTPRQVLWVLGAPGIHGFLTAATGAPTKRARGDKSNAVITIPTLPAQHKSLFNHFQQDQYAQERPSFLGSLQFSSTLERPPWSKTEQQERAKRELKGWMMEEGRSWMEQLWLFIHFTTGSHTHMKMFKCKL